MLKRRSAWIDKPPGRHKASRSKRRGLFTHVDGGGVVATPVTPVNGRTESHSNNDSSTPVDNKSRGNVRHYNEMKRSWNSNEEDENGEVSLGAVCVVLGAVLVLLVVFVFPGSSVTEVINVKDEVGELYLDWHSNQRIRVAGFLWGLFLSLLAGLGCCGFSWTVTYYDSFQPGRLPPTPFSPTKYRQASGHDFHSGYIMSVLNGVAMFGYATWWLSDKL